MRLIASISVLAAFCLQTPGVEASSIIGASGTGVYGIAGPGSGTVGYTDNIFGPGTGLVSFTVNDALGVSISTIDFITLGDGAPVGPFTETIAFAITNASGGAPITKFSIGFSSNAIGATLGSLGSITNSSGFTAGYVGGSPFGTGLTFVGGSIANGATGTFTVPFILPTNPAILAPGFSLVMTTNPEPTSLCLMGLGMAVAGGGSLWRKRRNKGLVAQPDEAPVA